jgi:hypothetical protein
VAFGRAQVFQRILNDLIVILLQLDQGKIWGFLIIARRLIVILLQLAWFYLGSSPPTKPQKSQTI